MSTFTMQLTTQKSHAGLVQSKHLAELYQTQPEQLDSIVSYMFDKYGSKTPLLAMTSGLGRTSQEVGNREIRWDLKGRHTKAINIVAPYATLGATPGLNQSQFEVVVDTQWFTKGDTLITDNGTRVRVMIEPDKVTNGYRLILEIETGDPAKYCDPAQLDSPCKLSKEYNTVGEFSDGGSTTYDTGFKMRSFLTTLAKSASISRDAATDGMNAVIKAIGPDGKSSVYTWCSMVEWTFLRQFMEEKETALVYSESTIGVNGVVNMKDTNGTPVYVGAGIRQQISSAYKRNYTVLTEKIIRDFLLDIISQPDSEGGRELVVFTGLRGMDEFDRAMKDSIRNWQLVTDKTFVTGSGSNMTLGGQFRSYIGLNDMKFTIRRLPCYDDAERHRTLHAKTGAPLESYRFTVLDLGMNGANPNLKIVHKKGSEMILGEMPGSVSLSGETSKSIRNKWSTTKDGTVVQGFSSFGAILMDPMNCGELICTMAK